MLVESGSGRKATPVPSLPMSPSIRASPFILLGIAIVHAALSRAAEMPADPGSFGPPPAGYVVAILAVTVNNQPQDEPVTTLRDDAGRVFVAAGDLAKWRLGVPSVDG